MRFFYSIARSLNLHKMFRVAPFAWTNNGSKLNIHQQEVWSHDGRYGKMSKNICANIKIMFPTFSPKRKLQTDGYNMIPTL